MQERIGKRSLVAGVRGFAKEGAQRVTGRERPECHDDLANPLIGGLNSHPSTELPEHVDAGAAVGGVHHEMHGAVGFENAAQSAKPGIRVGQMMQNSGANDVIEACIQFARAFNGKLVDVEIVQAGICA